LLLSLRDSSAATSGQGERLRLVQGREIGHLLDPRNGLPLARRGSATVVAPGGMEADALATALFVLGREEGMAWVRGRRDVAVAFLEPVSVQGGAAALSLHANQSFLRLLEAVDRERVRR
jgi:thiamine biosynthesis lipoprotein